MKSEGSGYLDDSATVLPDVATAREMTTNQQKVEQRGEYGGIYRVPSLAVGISLITRSSFFLPLPIVFQLKMSARW